MVFSDNPEKIKISLTYNKTEQDTSAAAAFAYCDFCFAVSLAVFIDRPAAATLLI